MLYTCYHFLKLVCCVNKQIMFYRKEHVTTDQAVIAVNGSLIKHRYGESLPIAQYQ